MSDDILASARKKLETGKPHLCTPAEFAALAKWSADHNPTMVPIQRVEPAKPARSKANAALIDDILIIATTYNRDDAKEALHKLFEKRGVQVVIEKTWTTDEDFASIKLG